MARFTMDNTDGYSQGELDELNRRYETAVSENRDLNSEPFDELWGGSVRDYLAEQVQAEFDAAH